MRVCAESPSGEELDPLVPSKAPSRVFHDAVSSFPPVAPDLLGCSAGRHSTLLGPAALHLAFQAPVQLCREWLSIWLISPRVSVMGLRLYASWTHSSL